MEDEDKPAKKMSGLKIDDNPAVNGTRPKSLKNGEVTGADLSTSDSKDGSPHSSSPDTTKARDDSISTPNTPQTLSSSKPLRKTSQKPSYPEPRLYDMLPDVTSEAIQSFQVIPDCLYGSRGMGSTDNEILDCDCKEDYHDGVNGACRSDEVCINRATKVECVIGASGSCGDACRNQRFQRKQYAKVSVIRTEKKGYGLRTDSDLQANDFIYEYIGEVIHEPAFRRRMLQYDNEGIKHFYFMSLSKHEFVDATRKGNFGRFCNHSCRPNCYVDKWVVGGKLRMGIFALRNVKAGEELVFNYNVDRYGADPQPCYCGESNCVGIIGGKTQTERATKLPLTVIEALGIESPDGWETVVAKKPRKKKPDENDEEYVDSIQARSLDDEGARKVMAALMQCKEKWIAVKLLQRIQHCNDERVLNAVVQMHAYQILKATLHTFAEDANVVLQALAILYRFPRLTKNKIVDSNIEATIRDLTSSTNEDVARESAKLLGEWDKLTVAYRIKRRKIDSNNAQATPSFDDRRGNGREDRDDERAASKIASPPSQIEIPKGPRSSVPQRNNFVNGHRPRKVPFFASASPLPRDWFAAKDNKGNTYYYNRFGVTTWIQPTQSAAEPAPKATPQALIDQQIYQNIIDEVTKDSTPKPVAVQTPQRVVLPVKDIKKTEKWRALPLDKQMKVYENTIFPHIRPVLDKFKHKLPKEDLKRFAKDITKKLVTSDYKNNRVHDPTAPLDEKAIRKVKIYVRDFLDRAVVKFQEHDKRRKAKERSAKHSNGAVLPSNDATPTIDTANPGDPAEPIETELSKPLDETAADSSMDIAMSDEESESPASTEEHKRKRKRDDDEQVSTSVKSPSGEPPPSNDVGEEDEDGSCPPPPPPPPPATEPEKLMTEEERALRQQEEELMRENEEAQRLEDEAAARDMTST